ncbi:MAG: T9SS type A sorting domain-containing protein, partial [Gemmatimonadetes bacterium]|nr:T9SS type A sorting domain-containing protein [Gemmatimonadota bacterium]
VEGDPYQAIDLTAAIPAEAGFVSVNGVEVDPNSGAYLISVFGAGVFRSVDQGESWQEFNEGIAHPNPARLALARDRVKSRVYVGTLGRGLYGRDLDGTVPVLLARPTAEPTSSGVRVSVTRFEPGALELWRSVDAMPPTFLARWDDVTHVDYHDDLAGLDRTQALDLRYEARVVVDGTLAAASGVGLLLAPSRGLTTRLLSAFPNPFNPYTTIRLELARPARVRVEILDVRGRRVAELHRGRLSSGRHNFPWLGVDRAGRPAASGVYFHRVSVDQQTLSGRMTLVR